MSVEEMHRALQDQAGTSPPPAELSAMSTPTTALTFSQIQAAAKATAKAKPASSVAASAVAAHGSYVEGPHTEDFSWCADLADMEEQDALPVNSSKQSSQANEIRLLLEMQQKIDRDEETYARSVEGRRGGRQAVHRRRHKGPSNGDEPSENDVRSRAQIKEKLIKETQALHANDVASETPSVEVAKEPAATVSPVTAAGPPSFGFDIASSADSSDALTLSTVLHCIGDIENQTPAARSVNVRRAAVSLFMAIPACNDHDGDPTVRAAARKLCSQHGNNLVALGRTPASVLPSRAFER